MSNSGSLPGRAGGLPGGNYVKCTTPLNNVRITSFFAGESEVNIIDPRKVEILTPRLGKSIYGTLDGNEH
jgi:hypothetical protein